MKTLIRMMTKSSRRPSFHRSEDKMNVQQEAGMTDSSMAP